MPAPLLIADVPWLLYRAFFSLPKSIVGSDGEPVNALLGTVNALLAVLEARPARAVAACMGAEEAIYRVRLYPGYHAQRDPMPPELARQWEKAPALLESLGWTVTTDPELEADDVMFSYALAEVGGDRHEEENTSGHESGKDGGKRGVMTNRHGNGRALLLTGDRDLFQAVTDQVAVVMPGKGGGDPTEIGPAQVRERYGIDPPLVTDFIALRGDPSDGLPGAPGIGAKTAAELLNAHDTLEALLEAAGAAADDRRTNAGESAPVAAASELADASTSAPALTIRPRVAATLRDNEQLLRTFARVATLQRIDVDAPPDRSTDYAGGAQAASDLGMTRLAARLRGMA